MPFIPALIARGAFLGSKLLGGKKGAKAPSPKDALIAQQTEASQFALGEARQVLPQARETLQGPLSFWETILGGDRQEMLSLLAPEVETIVSQYDTARRNITNLAPRGGGRTTAMAESRFEEAGLIQRLLQESRRMAAGEVADIGGQLTQLGVAELGISTGAAGNLISDLLRRETARRGQNIGTAADIGIGIGKILVSIFGGKG